MIQADGVPIADDYIVKVSPGTQTIGDQRQAVGIARLHPSTTLSIDAMILARFIAMSCTCLIM